MGAAKVTSRGPDLFGQGRVLSANKTASVPREPFTVRRSPLDPTRSTPSAYSRVCSNDSSSTMRSGPPAALHAGASATAPLGFQWVGLSSATREQHERGIGPSCCATEAAGPPAIDTFARPLSSYGKPGRGRPPRLGARRWGDLHANFGRKRPFRS
jgi:hypothetical protein